MGRSITSFMNFFFKKCPGYIRTLFYSLFQIRVSITLKNTYKYTSRNYTETKIHFVRKFIIGKSEVLSIRKFWGPIVQSMNIIIRVFFMSFSIKKKLNQKVCRSFALQATWKTGMISYVLVNNSVRCFRWPPIGKKWISKYKSP